MVPITTMLRLLLPRPESSIFRHGLGFTLYKRNLTTTSSNRAKKMPDRPKILEDNITEVFVKGSGPGGQKINKTSSAVQLKHLPTGIVVKNQDTRSREQNRKLARRRLAEKVEILEKGDQSRVAIIQETQRKKKSSAVKKSKRKYRLLEEAKAQEAAEKEDVGGGEGVK